MCLKLAVYAIAKNEVKHVKKWYDSIKDGADGIFVTDTGSTDGTIELLEALGVKVDKATVSPWRFDLARNLSLMNVPEDYDMCLCLDLDEIMLPNWREELDKIYFEGLNMVRYPYIFSWEDEACTIPRISLYQFKIHSRKGYIWKYPVHEILDWIGEGEENEIICESIVSHHFQDNSKPRNYQYLLDEAVKEYPDDQRMSHLRGRELFMFGRHEEAIEELKKHLKLTEWTDDISILKTRAMSMRYIARALYFVNQRDEKEDGTEILRWFMRSVAESPEQREGWIWLANAWYSVGKYRLAHACAEMGLTITDKKNSIENESICWSDFPEQLIKDSLQLLEEAEHEASNNEG